MMNVKSNMKKKLILPKKGNFKFIDLFCGIGGFHQALTKLGGVCVFASDIDEQCRLTYEKNYGLKPHGDITTKHPRSIPDFDILTGGFPRKNVTITTKHPRSIPDFDILTGGFPRQSFSNSGKKEDWQTNEVNCMSIFLILPK